MKGLKGLFHGTLPLFLTLWVVMMAVLAWLNAGRQEAVLASAMESAQQQAQSSYLEIWAGGASEARKPVILTGRLSGAPLFPHDACAYFRVYDDTGTELARSQLTLGSACAYGTGVYEWYLFFDPVLTEEEHLELARWMSGDWRRQSFYGTAGGLYEPSETDGLYCQVVGVVDEERQVIYPQRVSYHYTDRTVVLVDSQSDFFDGKELTTCRFDAVQLSSALLVQRASPREMLGYYRQAEEKAERILEGTLPARNVVSTSSDGSAYVPIGESEILVSSYAYGPLRAALTGLVPTAFFTLVAAAAMAAFTDRRQRQALRRERAFTRAAAHELKTPLAVLRAHAEALKEDIDPAKRERYLDVLLSESDRMAGLVGGLLGLSRLESGEKPRPERVELSALVEEAFDRLALPLGQKKIALELELTEQWVRGDRAWLEMAVGNLASNALRYCPEGGGVAASLAGDGKNVVLTVDNDGPPIPEADLPRIWEPFYRGDPSRSRSTGGTGLGLAIVRAAAQAHGGSCIAANRPGGVTFRLVLPACNPDGDMV